MMFRPTDFQAKFQPTLQYINMGKWPVSFGDLPIKVNPGLINS